MTGRAYDVINIALPRNGFNGVEKNADTPACRNNIAESGLHIKETINKIFNIRNKKLFSKNERRLSLLSHFFHNSNIV